MLSESITITSLDEYLYDLGKTLRKKWDFQIRTKLS